MTAIDPYFRVEVVSQTPYPEHVIYMAMHQDEEDTFDLPLTNCQKSAIVSTSDADWASDFAWHVMKVGYVARTVYDPATQKSTPVYLHREIFDRRGLSLGRARIDHKNGNKLDNSFHNLRLASQSQNMSNRQKPISNTSGFKGVRFHKPTGKWQAYIKHNYKQKHLGLFVSAEDAALAYNKAAVELHGQFACLNEVERG